MRRIVLADACVLAPASVCDTLLRLAAENFFSIRWSAEILDETRRALAGEPFRLTPSQLDYRVREMRRAFPDADVLDYEDELRRVTNKPKDRHVLAAAVAGEADTIATFDTRHFPPGACSPFGITVQTPDELFCRCLKEDPELVNQLLIEQSVALKNPSVTQTEMLRGLYLHAPTFVEALVTDFGVPGLRQLMAILPRRRQTSSAIE
jgi:predicted nucleic acid-binding protein